MKTRFSDPLISALQLLITGNLFVVSLHFPCALSTDINKQGNPHIVRSVIETGYILIWCNSGSLCNPFVDSRLNAVQPLYRVSSSWGFSFSCWSTR